MNGEGSPHHARLWGKRTAPKLCFLILTQILLLGSATWAQELTLRLFEEKDWSLPEAPENALPEGRIFFFRAGSYRPELILEANVPGLVPAGVWHFIAEAPGHISVGDSSLVVTGETNFQKTVELPLVPACDLDLVRPDRWRGVQRIDAVSFSRQAVYTISPKDRLAFKVPTGPFLIYTVTSGEIEGISSVQQCQPGEEIELQRPTTPPLERQDLVLSARVPTGMPADSKRALSMTLRTASSSDFASEIPPTASIWAGNRLTSFFLGAPGSRSSQAVISHPELLTRKIEMDALPGGVRELEEVQLRPRVTQHLTIEYQPARNHALEVLALLQCDDLAPSIGEGKFQHCRDSASQPLVPELHTYSFENLDVGWYLPEARFPDEKVPGLGNWFSFSVKADAPPEQQSPPQLLKELHIFGHLLVDDQPIEGFVRLVPSEIGDGPPRVAPTDDELQYHLFYFGQAPTVFSRSQLPEEYRDLDSEDLRGLLWGYRLDACDGAGGFCKIYQRMSTLSGSGRLDLDLGPDREVLLRVIDARTGAGVPGTRVALAQRGKKQSTLHFVGGEKIWRAEATREGLGTSTDPNGEIRLRDLPAGEVAILVHGHGYQRWKGTLDVPELGRVELEVALDPEDTNSRGGVILRLTSGATVENAYLLPQGLADLGQRMACAGRSNLAGEVEISEPCLEKAPYFVVLHPSVLIQRVTSSDLENSGEIRLAPARTRGPSLRLTTREGRPAAGQIVGLRTSDFEIIPEDFIQATTRTSQPILTRTDGDGLLHLLHLAADAFHPEIGLYDSTSTLRWQPLITPDTGEVVVIELP